MFVIRLFATCALSLIASNAAPAQSSSPAARNPPIAPQPSTTPAGPQISFSSVYVEGPYIAMTFDDGPDESLTPRLLDLLATHRIKATFFVVGQNAADHPDIVRRAAREGHEIANHSWSHPNLGKMSDESVRQELRRTDKAIHAAIGTRPALLRPPYGSMNARQKRWIHDEFGYRIILWDVDPLDWKRPGPSVVCNRILKETRDGSIVLAHDIHPPTIAAMPATFDQLLAKGFKFVTVSELLAMARPAPPKALPVAMPVETTVPLDKAALSTPAGPNG